MELWTLVYLSREAYDLEPGDLLKLLVEARSRNRESGITGLLLHRERRFMQVLEGKHDAVRRLFRQIEQDPRHRDVRVLAEGPLDRRLFSEWQMGFAQGGLIAQDNPVFGAEYERAVEARLFALPRQDPVVALLVRFLTEGARREQFA